MSPSPKSPDENKLPEDETSSTDEFAHPPFHLNDEYVASSDESNSDEEINPTNASMGNFDGYCLLPQDNDVNQAEKQYESEGEDEEEEEFRRFATLRAIAVIDDDNPPQLTHSSLPLGESVWSSKLESESFPVDDDKANYIKARMLDIQLPQSSIPTWAQLCSEEDWQEKLRERITCRQTTFFSEEKN